MSFSFTIVTSLPILLNILLGDIHENFTLLTILVFLFLPIANADVNGSSVDFQYSNWGNLLEEARAPHNYQGDDENGQDAAVLRLSYYKL